MKILVISFKISLTIYKCLIFLWLLISQFILRKICRILILRCLSGKCWNSWLWKLRLFFETIKSCIASKKIALLLRLQLLTQINLFILWRKHVRKSLSRIIVFVWRIFDVNILMRIVRCQRILERTLWKTLLIQKEISLRNCRPKKLYFFINSDCLNILKVFN